jgi:hypothetical protein
VAPSGIELFPLKAWQPLKLLFDADNVFIVAAAFKVRT